MVGGESGESQEIERWDCFHGCDSVFAFGEIVEEGIERVGQEGGGGGGEGDEAGEVVMRVCEWASERVRDGATLLVGSRWSLSGYRCGIGMGGSTFSGNGVDDGDASGRGEGVGVGLELIGYFSSSFTERGGVKVTFRIYCIYVLQLSERN